MFRVGSKSAIRPHPRDVRIASGKRTSRRHPGWSLKCHKLCEQSQQTNSLFDHSAGAGEQPRGHFETKRLRGWVADTASLSSTAGPKAKTMTSGALGGRWCSG